MKNNITPKMLIATGLILYIYISNFLMVPKGK